MKRIVITGANSGFGYALTKNLAKKGHHIIMACRNMSKGKKAKETLEKEIPDATLDLLELDLSQMGSVQRFAKKLERDYMDIHVFVNNAGMFTDRYKWSKEGFELTMASNYLGQVVLTHLVYPLVKKGRGKILNISSTAAFYGRLKVRPDLFTRRNKGFKAYATSKLAQLMFTIDLANESQDVPIIAIHPGLVASNIWRGQSWYMKFVEAHSKKYRQPEEACLIGVEIALDEEGRYKSGKFYREEGEVEYHKKVMDSSTCHALKQLTATTVNDYLC